MTTWDTPPETPPTQTVGQWLDSGANTNPYLLESLAARFGTSGGRTTPGFTAWLREQPTSGFNAVNPALVSDFSDPTNAYNSMVGMGSAWGQKLERAITDNDREFLRRYTPGMFDRPWTQEQLFEFTGGEKGGVTRGEWEQLPTSVRQQALANPQRTLASLYKTRNPLNGDLMSTNAGGGFYDWKDAGWNQNFGVAPNPEKYWADKEPFDWGEAITLAMIGAIGGYALAPAFSAGIGSIAPSVASTAIGGTTAGTLAGQALAGGTMSALLDPNGPSWRSFGHGALAGGLGSLGAGMGAKYLGPQGLGLPTWAAKPLAGAAVNVAKDALLRRPIDWQGTAIRAGTGMVGNYAGLTPAQQGGLNLFLNAIRALPKIVRR